MKNALFTTDGHSYYPANKDAVAICCILSKMKLKEEDMLSVRSKGYIPRTANGEEIERVRIDT